jgi:hypothetical protein
MNWQDVLIRRGVRQRTAANEPPQVLTLLSKEDKDLLATWVRKDHASRSRDALLKEAGIANIERAEALSDWLLREGWITRKEKLQGGSWHWEGLTWRDLDRLKTLIGVGSRTQRDEARSRRFEQAHGWLQSLPQDTDPELHNSVTQAVDQLAGENALRVDVVSTRLDLLVFLVEWCREEMNGTRRDFALFAGEHTKSISASDWKWLERHFDLESLGVSHFLPVIWLAGDIQLKWEDRVLDLAPVRCLAIPVEDILRVSAISQAPDHWWLIENRASFERQSGQRPNRSLMAWLPGRPSRNWVRAIEHLLQLCPAPLKVSADADPAGIDIARAVGAIWAAHGQQWEPYRMGVHEWEAVSQKWPLNEHDVALLQRLLSDPNLPRQMTQLGRAMLEEGRKAEQEGWL